MKVIVRNPQRRELELHGRRRVEELMRELGLNPEVYIAIRGRDLLTRDQVVGEEETVEFLSAVSGG
jgi:sulfur carrier protein ThiS